MALKGKKQVKGKWNFLLMRPKGEVTNFAVSPLFLAVALIFALAFTIGSLAVANLYFSLYLDYQELAARQREIQAQLNQLDGRYKYQIALAQDYAELMNDLDLPGPGAGPDEAGPEGPEVEEPAAAPEASAEDTSGEVPPLPPESPEEDPLETWAARLPGLAVRTEDNLQVDDFKADGPRFSFQLINEASGSLARGRLLALFLVKAEGRLLAVPFPDFDPFSPRPDFEPGPGYNIRSSKQISGQLKIPAGSEIVAAMVAAQSSDGRLVMKKRIQP